MRIYSVINPTPAFGGGTLSLDLFEVAGAPPAVAGAVDAVDVYSLVTRDGGVPCYDFPAEQDFS